MHHSPLLWKCNNLVVSYYSLAKPFVSLFCRCGAQFGHLKALTRALLLTPTVHHVSGSLAPFPIPMSSLHTLAARQTPPWTPSGSVSCGDSDSCMGDWTWSHYRSKITNIQLRLPRLDCQKAGGLKVDYIFSSYYLLMGNWCK